MSDTAIVAHKLTVTGILVIKDNLDRASETKYLDLGMIVGVAIANTMGLGQGVWLVVDDTLIHAPNPCRVLVAVVVILLATAAGGLLREPVHVTCQDSHKGRIPSRSLFVVAALFFASLEMKDHTILPRTGPIFCRIRSVGGCLMVHQRPL